MKNALAVGSAYLAAFTAVVVGLVLLGKEFSCVREFPLGILDKLVLWDEYLQVATGASFIISGLVSTLMLGFIRADSCQPSAWEQRREQDLAKASLKKMLWRVRKA